MEFSAGFVPNQHSKGHGARSHSVGANDGLDLQVGVSLLHGPSSPGHEFSAAPHTRCSETAPTSGTQTHSRLLCQQLRSGPPAQNSGLARFAAFHLRGHHTEVTYLHARPAPAADGQLLRAAPSAPLPLRPARRPEQQSSVLIHCLS